MIRASDKALAGQRVLIVEDRFLIAAEMADEVGRLGGSVAGLCRDMASAAQVLAAGDVDLALLDVNLEGEVVYPLALELAEKDVPFIFVTGYDASVLPAEWRSRPRLPKPIDLRALGDELERLKRRAKPSA